MSPSKSKEIETIEDLFLKGDLYEVITLSDKILANKDSTKLDTFQANLLKGRSMDLLCVFEHRREQIGEGLVFFENAVQDSSQQESLILQLESLDYLSGTQINLRRYENALKTIDKMEQIYESAKDIHPTEQKHAKAIMIGVEASKLNIDFYSGKDSPENRFESLIKLMKKRLKLYQELNFQVEILQIQYNLGYSYYTLEDY